MARRVWALCRATQWNLLKSSVAGPMTRVYASHPYNTQRQLLASSISPHISLSCCRSQHHQSDANSDDSDYESLRPRRESRDEHLAILTPIIRNGEKLSKEEWSHVKNEVINSKSFVNEENIDGIIMGLCTAQGQFGVGSSYLDALKESNVVPNIVTLGRYLKLCYMCRVDDEETVLGICDEIRRRCPVMDASVADFMIHGLALTSRWEEGFELLSEVRLSSDPFISSFNVLAETAFRNGEFTKGWDIMKQIVEKNRKPLPSTYKAWIDQCLRTKGSEASVMIGQLLNFWTDHDQRPSLDVAEHLRYWFESDNYEWEGCFTELTPGGSCMNCRTNLRKQKVSISEFETMRKKFLEQVIVGNNVFLKTDPDELETFQQFVSRTAPYDVVIDGLNVSYGKGASNPTQAVRLLETVVHYFAKRRKQILVLGRRHMQSWPQRPMSFIHEHASVFFAQDMSQDDPFLLYAAMFSGMSTQFVSRDLMRGHVYLLKNPSLQRVFRSWQQQQQLNLYVDHTGSVIVRPPLRFNPSVQQGPGQVWHVPYDLEFKVAAKQTLEPPKYWLCLRKGVEHTYDDEEDRYDHNS